jgi:hypothetical protein
LTNEHIKKEADEAHQVQGHLPEPLAKIISRAFVHRLPFRISATILEGGARVRKGAPRLSGKATGSFAIA